MKDRPYAVQADFVQSASKLSQCPVSPLPELAVVGRSNVGKSSLINGLLNRRSLARVSNTPGRTQLLNFFRVNDKFLLCDLPGYGYARVPRNIQRDWGKMIEGYLNGRENLRALMLLIDSRREVGEWEMSLVRYARSRGLGLLVVATKIDKLRPNQRRLSVARQELGLQLGRGQVVAWSALSFQGRDVLWQRIEQLIALPAVPVLGPQAAQTAEGSAEETPQTAEAEPGDGGAEENGAAKENGGIVLRRTRRFVVRRGEAQGAAVEVAERPAAQGEADAQDEGGDERL